MLCFRSNCVRFCFSVEEAAAIIAGAERHLSVLYAAISYVRLRLQGRPAELPLEKRTAATRSLAKLSERALVHADRIFAEIRFLHAFAQQVSTRALYDSGHPSFGSQPISEGKSWIPTNQIF